MYILFYFQSLILSVGLILAAYQIEAKCDACGTNGIACVNETSFHMCYDGNQDKSEILTCPSNKICVRSSMKCVDPGMGLTPDCIPDRTCSYCDGSKLFTCTSRTTYAMCNGDQLTDFKGVCPPKLVCDSSSSEICVTECKLTNNQIECDRESE